MDSKFLGSFKAQVDSLQKELIQVSKNNIWSAAHNGFCSGNTGILLYLIEAESAYPDSVGVENIQDHLATLQDQIDYRKLPHRIDIGSVGIAWMQEYINQKFGDADEDINQDVDRLMLNALSTEKWTGEFELLGGLAGIGIYGVKRANFETGRKILTRVIDHLEKLAQKMPEGIAWETTRDSTYFMKKFDFTQYNLGLAHGNPSVIGLLNKAAGVSDDERILPMLKDSCHWLIRQRLPEESSSYFSSLAGSSIHSRIGWCYGDISNALVLWRAGKILGDDEILDVAKKVAMKATLRRNLHEAAAYDAGLCHGTAGNMLIFLELYKEMQEQALLDYATFWLETTLKYKNEAEGLKGLYKLSPDFEEKQEAIGLLEGFAGIGLCLLAAAGFDSGWKEILLLE